MTTPDAALVPVHIPAPPTAAELGLMVGHPPPADGVVTFDTMLSAPWNRWSPQHARELLPSANVSRGTAPVRPLHSTPVDLSGVTFTAPDGRLLDMESMKRIRYMDAMVVLHRGQVVHEDYRNGMHADTPHVMYSVTKSVVGTLALQAKHAGLLDPTAPVTQYVPELADSAWGTASVQQTLDMSTSLAFDEGYADSGSQFMRYLIAAGYMAAPEGYTGARHLTALCQELQQDPSRPHGHAFNYITANTDVAAWVLARATGLPLQDLLSTNLWSQTGAEHDAYVTMDSIATPFAGAGLNATARDMARLGQLILDGGVWDGRRVLAAEVVADLYTPGDPEVFARGRDSDPDDWLLGGSYRNFWWYSASGHEAFTGIGINGQWLYIDRVARMVAVVQSSHPEASVADLSRITARGLHAIALHLLER